MDSGQPFHNGIIPRTSFKMNSSRRLSRHGMIPHQQFQDGKIPVLIQNGRILGNLFKMEGFQVADSKWRDSGGPTQNERLLNGLIRQPTQKDPRQLIKGSEQATRNGKVQAAFSERQDSYSEREDSGALFLIRGFSAPFPNWKSSLRRVQIGNIKAVD